jgi:hypothetical protein
MYVYAARYSDDINRDMTLRACSAGWNFEAYADEASTWREIRAIVAESIRLGDAWDELPDARRAALIDDEIERLGYLPVPTADGYWLVGRVGLSAWVGATVREAVEAALADERFADDPRPLYVLRVRACDVYYDDEDTYVFDPCIARVMTDEQTRVRRVR